MNNQKINYIFFGSSRLSVIVLDELSKYGLMPTLIITSPDKPVGRKQILTANVTKRWAQTNNIPFLDPARLDQEFIEKLKIANTNPDGTEKCPVFLVASYGKIIPETIINIPSKKTLNIHPSLLPRYRGPSPLPSAMLEDTKETGVTIMRMDERMDHGPIIVQKNITVNEWPTYEDFEEMMAREGAKLFAEILPKWVGGQIKEQEQDHTAATYTKKIIKEDGLIEIKGNGLVGTTGAKSDNPGKNSNGSEIIFLGDPYSNFRKIQAYHEWPQTYFFIKRDNRDLRVKITEAEFKDGKLIIKKVIPEGGKEMQYEDFMRGYIQ